MELKNLPSTDGLTTQGVAHACVAMLEEAIYCVYSQLRHRVSNYVRVLEPGHTNRGPGYLATLLSEYREMLASGRSFSTWVSASCLDFTVGSCAWVDLGCPIHHCPQSCTVQCECAEVTHGLGVDWVTSSGFVEVPSRCLDNNVCWGQTLQSVSLSLSIISMTFHITNMIVINYHHYCGF